MNNIKKYKEPNYLQYIPEIFWEYFDEKNFINKPYPVTFEEANAYLLYDVFKVDKAKKINITIKMNNSKKELEITKDNFHHIFDFNNWHEVDLATKITALYWFFEEQSHEMNVYKPRFVLTSHSSYDFISNIVAIFIDDKILKNSAYELLDLIAHELKHCETDNLEQKDYFLKYNNLYCLSPKSKNFNFEKDFEKFKYDFEYALYKFQPIELIAYDFGEQKAKEIFIENLKANKNSFHEKDSLFFRNLNNNRKTQNEFKKLVFKNEFLDQLDKRYLLLDLEKDLKNLKLKALNCENIKFEKENKSIVFSKEQEDLFEKINSKIQDINTLKAEINTDLNRLYHQYLKKINEQDLVPYK